MSFPALPDPEVTLRALPSGLRVVAIRLPHLHSAAAEFLVRAGSRHETRQTAGLSHFVEHMVFRGSAGYPDSLTLNRAIERLGGNMNAETSREYTSFVVECPPECLDPLLGVLADAVMHPRWPGISIEQRIVEEELLEETGEDGELIDAEILVRQLLVGNHPIGLPIAGTKESVGGFDEAACAAHHARYFCGRNAILALAGPFEPEALIDAAERAFADLPPGEPSLPEPAPTRDTGPRFRYVYNPESQTTVDVSYRVHPPDHALAGAQSLLARIIDDGLSSRLHRRIVDELGLAYSVGASLETLTDAAWLDFEAACAHPTAPRLLEEMLAISADLRREPPTGEEFEMAKNRLVWDVRATIDYPRAVANFYASSLLLRDGVGLRERLERILAVEPAHIHEVAQTVFQPARFAAVAVGHLDKRRLRTLRRICSAENLA